jgi:hypothetical protein
VNTHRINEGVFPDLRAKPAGSAEGLLDEFTVGIVGADRLLCEQLAIVATGARIREGHYLNRGSGYPNQPASPPACHIRAPWAVEGRQWVILPS